MNARNAGLSTIRSGVNRWTAGVFDSAQSNWQPIQPDVRIAHFRYRDKFSCNAINKDYAVTIKKLYCWKFHRPSHVVSQTFGGSIMEKIGARLSAIRQKW